MGRRRINHITSFDQIPPVVDTEYLAELLRMNVKVMQKWCKDGRIKATKCGRVWRIPRDEIIRICEGGAVI